MKAIKYLLTLLLVVIIFGILNGCAAMKNKTCVEYKDRLEARRVCHSVGGYVCRHGGHAHKPHRHGGSVHCDHGRLRARRVCHYETVTVQDCIRYVCKPGYVRNKKNHCVYPVKPKLKLSH